MPSNTDDQRARSIMAAVNEAIDRLHGSLDVAESEFFCECGHSGCRERLTLSRAEYASLLDASRPLLSAAHADREYAVGAELRSLGGQVHQLHGTRASRVKVEEATGVLVDRHGMTADAAFETLRDRARNQRRSLGEVCSDVIDWAGTVDGDRASKPKLQALTPQRSGEAGR